MHPTSNNNCIDWSSREGIAPTKLGVKTRLKAMIHSLTSHDVCYRCKPCLVRCSFFLSKQLFDRPWMHRIISIVRPHALVVAALASHMVAIGTAARSVNIRRIVFMVDVVLSDSAWQQKERMVKSQLMMPQRSCRWKICASCWRCFCHRCHRRAANAGWKI